MTEATPTRHAAYLRQRYFPALDGMRAICILLVLISHTDRNAPAEKMWNWLSGYLGVPIFFVLSGFLITTLSLREEDKNGSLSLAGFYCRRLFRICPLYFLVLALYAALSFGVMQNRQHEMADGLPYFMTYLNEFSPVTIFNQSWSLGIEEKFYLVWPLLAFTVWRGKTRTRFISTAVLIAMPLSIGAYAGILKDPHVALWLPGYGMIMIGCLLAEALHHRQGFAWLERLASTRWAVATLGVTLAMHTAMALVTERAGAAYALAETVYAAGAAVCLIPLLIGNVPWAPALRSRVMSFIGSRSYAIYLVHNLCVDAVQRLSPQIAAPRIRTLALLAGTLLMSAVVADIMHRLIEQPFIKLGRSLTGRLAYSNVAVTR